MKPAAHIWTDSLGNRHDLTTAPLLSIGETAQRMKCSKWTVRRRIALKELAPVFRHNSNSIEVYECALPDYFARKLSAQ